MSRALPLEKFAVDDGRGTEVYVSASDAEVALVTTTRTRALAWIATIPHWFYITPLRVNQPLWYWTVVWTSGLGCVLAVLGLVLGVTQFRKSTPFQPLEVDSATRAGCAGTTSSACCSACSRSPGCSAASCRWSRSTGPSATASRCARDAFTGGAARARRASPRSTRARGARCCDGRTLKEIELRRIQDEPYYVARYSAARGRRRREARAAASAVPDRRPRAARDAPDRRRARCASRHEPFSVDSLLARLRAGAPGAAIVEHELLADYDSYYYSRGRQAPLPVLRVKFDDPMETWVYVDPATSQLLASIHRLNRVERWLYNGLHSLDFGFWYDRRPLWDIGMIALCAGALASSAIGLYLGLKRVRRDFARLARTQADARLIASQ